MKFIKRSKQAQGSVLWAGLLALAAFAAVSAHAEDTEIYKATQTTTPYVMLLLDTSGSMSGGIADDSISETNPQRMATMKAALHQLLSETETSDDYHIGMARYTAPGGAIMYPVRRLGDPASVERTFTGASPADDFSVGSGFVSDGAMFRLASDESSKVGVRIANVTVPRGAIVESAALVLTTNNNYVGSAQVRARVAQQGNVPPIVDQAAFDAITWSDDVALSDVVPETGLQNQMAITLDVSSQLNTRLLASDWAAGNALLFEVSAVSGDVGVFSAEGTLTIPRSDGRLLNQYRPHLFVKYRVDAGNAFSARPTTVRDALHGVVDLMPTIGDTPLIGAYYEASRYMLGENVEFGQNRGNSSWRALMRTSKLESLLQPATVNRNALCSDVALNSRTCYSESISGTPRYSTPLPAMDCTVSPAIVMLTDGEPNNERCPRQGEEAGELRCDLGRIDNALRDSTGLNESQVVGCDGTDPWDCGIKLSRVLANPARFGITSKPAIPTYTISFGEGLDGGDDSAAANLMRLARGGYGDDPPDDTLMGKYYQATSGEQLSAAFRNIFGDVASGVKVQASTGISVDQTNRAQHTDQLYFSLFEPSKDVLWPGNLKRYRLLPPTVVGGKSTIVDANNAPAVAIDGYFRATSQSFWSDNADGGKVDQGGAREKLPLNRTVFTYLDAYPEPFPSTGLELQSLNASLANSDEYALRLQTLLETATNDDSAGVINWLTQSKVMGAPLHTKPLLINSGFQDSDPTRPIDTVYLSTNQGLLHAVNPETGVELFSFVPKELLKNQKRFKDTLAGNQLYGLDASWVAYRNDANRDGNISGSDEFINLYGGMRMGGNNYYALDVTNSRSSSEPRLRFVITPTTQDDGQTPYASLGQTWSVPLLTRLTNNCRLATPQEICTTKAVMIFGGGYDYAAHEKTGEEMPRSSGDTYGAGLYIVDAKRGSFLWRANGSGSGTKTTPLNGMDFSITSTIRAFDVDYDGFPDYLYAVDLGGQILRFELAKNEHGRSTWEIKSGKIVAKLGGSASALAKDYRRFYDAPAITPMRDPDGTRWVSIAVGSGYRSHPTDIQTDEIFFMVRDNDPYRAANADLESTVTIDDLVDVSSTYLETDQFDGFRGWYMKLDRTGPSDAGEKVVGEPVVLNENLVFTTYVPSRPSMLQCEPQIGHMVAYGVKLRTSAPMLDLNDDGVLERFADNISPGLSAGVAVIQSPTLNGETDEYLAIGPTLLDFDSGTTRTFAKTRWRSNEQEAR